MPKFVNGWDLHGGSLLINLEHVAWFKTQNGEVFVAHTAEGVAIGGVRRATLANRLQRDVTLPMVRKSEDAAGTEPPAEAAE
jgi:hypothetical protein